jgi:tetratricopeptide (TPR) repeat protein
MTPGGRPMLLDFNLCRDERHTTRESWGGTVPYMSPEQLKSMCPGEPHRLAAIGARSDIFSLGVILYELLCGSLPFGPIPWESTWEKMRDELLDRQRVGPRPMPHAAQVDPELIGLLRRCLAFDANDRPASAQAFADALRQYLSPSCRARRWVRARRRPMLAGACALLAVLGASGYALAVRDPYSVRQLQRGISYYRQDNFREAIKCLSRAVDADANLAPALFMRGRAHQQLGALNLALADYVAADGLVRDGPTLACIGYCSTLLTLHDSAIWNFKKAIEAGFDRAEVYNDLGYIYARMDKYEDARRCFDQAVARGPKLQTAYYNRAMFEFQWALEESNPIPETVIPDIQTAISLGPVTAQLLCDAARIYAVAARSDRDWIEPALRYLERSIELGQDPRPLVEDRSFFALRELPEFIACLEHPAVPSSAPRPVRVLDPVTRFAD